jgi:plastocyanin
METRFSVTVLLVVLIAAAVGIIAAQKQPHTVAAPAPAATATPVPTPLPDHVNIVANAGSGPVALFAPTLLVVSVGQKVTWVNVSNQAHSVIADDDAFDSGVLSAGETFSWTPKKPGTYHYSCFLHPDMQGTIFVQP